MTNQELYIDGIRINLGVNFGVRLNRQLLNPAELNTKDAQFSFSITVPTGGVNDKAFNYSSIEETSDKFNRLYAADYIADGIRIFRGNFKLTSVTRTAYKGNLYVPAPKTIKDIFGEIKLNQNPELRIPFADFVTSVNGYNTAAAIEPQPAIFPYTLYGVLPKSPLNKNANTYSARTLWDASVRLGLQDLPPSINPLIMLKHIFAAQGYSLQGTAFDDERLSKLYLSYKNASDYVQPWNYGQFAKMHVRGGWASRYNWRTGGEQLERGVSQGNDSTGVIYGCDLLDATNTAIEIVEDTGGNVLYSEVNDGSGRTYVRAQIRIPTSGFYKVKFNASLQVDDAENWRTTDPATGVQHVGGRTSNAVNNFGDNIYEVRLCRDRKTADFGINSPRLNGVFYYNNQPQNQTFDGNNVPKYFPQVLDGQTNFIDAAQDKQHLIGFNFGRHEPVVTGSPFSGFGVSPANPEFYNPKNGLEPNAQLLVAKPAISWDASQDNANPTRLAVKSAGYWKYGRIGDFDNEGDNPNENLDYSTAPRETGKILDAQGNAQAPPSGNISTIIDGYFISALTGFQTPASGWSVSDFIELTEYSGINFTAWATPNTSAAIVAYYDALMQFIGAGVVGTTALQQFTNEPISPPAEAYYVRFSGSSAYTIPNTGVDADFPLTGGQGYTWVNQFPTVALAHTVTAFRIKMATASTITLYKCNNDNTGMVSVGTFAVGVGVNDLTGLNIPLAAGQRIGVTLTDAAYYRSAGGVGSWAGSVLAGIEIYYTYSFTLDRGALEVLGTNAAGVNVILNRFQLARFFTYKIETDPADNYSGYAYIHNGADVNYLQRIDFVDGVAEFNTAYSGLVVVDPKLTLYLKTANFDVDGTLTISRQIQNGSEDVIDWELTNKYKIDLNNAPANYARRGQYQGAGADANWNAQGEVNAVVWLDAGELLTVASLSSEGRYRRNGMHSTFGWASHRIQFDLSVQPFRVDPDWLKVNLQGNGTAVMDWNDAPNFDTDSINLVGFLNADIKTDEFIDNFCKAFNLRLSQIDLNTYALDVKQSKTAVSNRFVNLDKIASVKDRENTPLGLPSIYKIGFTVDVEEQGYAESGDNGGGEYETGAIEGGVVEQKSTFSYNWFKTITKVETGGNVNLVLPIISKADVWNAAMPYPEAMRKRYTDLAYRFWYYDGLLNSTGATFAFNGASLQLARVSNQIAGVSVLNYKNQPYTILDNYFTVLINGSSHYTELEGFVTPAMYVQLDGSIMAMFNGDLYFIAELGGYDPTRRNKTNIKLIRKI